MAKQRIVPFFIPMEGCPHRCVYCDQVAISGHSRPPLAAEIAAALADLPPDPQAEAAFYGGSFTCLPLESQRSYLQAAAPALAAGRIGGLRISTRPDAVDSRVCDFLRGHGVTTVELGVQSFAPQVLAASGRGYPPEMAERACRAVRGAGLRLGVQLMTGLPQDTPQLDLEAVYRSADLGAQLLRIYPTLVLKHTPLAASYAVGDFQPQTLDEAVDCCREMAIAALAQGMTLIRIGINPAPEIAAALVAGPYHPAFGGLVREAMKKEQIADLLAAADRRTPSTLFFPAGDEPLIWGHRRATMRQLAADYPCLSLQCDAALPRGALRWRCGSREEFSYEQDWCRRRAKRH